MTNNTYDMVTLLQLRHKECRLVGVVYRGHGTVNAGMKQYTFKVPANFVLSIGDLLIDAQVNGSMQVVQVVDDNADDNLTIDAGIRYRWLDPDLSSAYDAQHILKRDDNIRRQLAMGEAMESAQRAAERAGIVFGSVTCVEHKDNDDG